MYNYPFNSKFNSNSNKKELKCTCVPSGFCHNLSLSGCPHKHKYKIMNELTKI